MTCFAACGLVVDTSGLSDGASAPMEAGTPDDGGRLSNDTGADVATDTRASDASTEGGPPSSCLAGGPDVSACGPTANESCCLTPLVAGGLYKRGHDGVVLFDFDHEARISAFRLDRFEVTVGRFRSFVAAVVAGWTPAAGAGKHTHLNGGAGLAATGAASTFEPGWDSSLDGVLPKSALGWSTELSCHASFQTWTNAPGPNEQRPINCVSWPQAYAFCIWDRAFLPSETEAAYAEQGGDEQRVYPWSNPPTSKANDCTYANGAGCVMGASNTNAVGTESPKGDGRWQQADLAGNLREWALDVYVAGYTNPCVDCVVLSGGTDHATHGSGYFNDPAGSTAGFRGSAPGRDIAVGVRCARIP